MKKAIITSIAIAGIHVVSHAQLGFDQRASGQSTLLFRGANIGLDISDASMGLGINNLDRTLGRKKSLIYGAAVSSKNAEGLGDIFSGGDFVPDSKMEGFFGVSVSNGDKVTAAAERAEQGLSVIIDREVLDFDRKFSIEFPKIVDDAAKLITDESKRKRFVRNTLKGFREEENRVKYISSLQSEDAEETDAIERIQDQSAVFVKAHNAKLDGLKEQKQKLRKQVFDKAFYQNASVFLLGGVTGSDFKRFTGLDSTDYSNSFKDEHFRGGYIGAGVNVQLGNLYIGSTYSYSATNNFALLTKKEYTWRRVYTSGNQSLTQDKKITAYSDAYAEIEVNEFAFDMAYNFKLDSASKYHVIVNPYARAIAFTRNSALLPERVTIGTGAYLFDKTTKFLGGIYVELADVSNNYEMMKPVDEQNMRKPQNRITFGLTAKFSLTKLQNTLRLTDDSKK